MVAPCILVLNTDDVAKLLPMADWIAALDDGFRDLGMRHALKAGRSKVYTVTS